MESVGRTCTKCGSNRVKQQSKLFYFLFLLGGGGILLWLGFIFPFLFVVSIAMIVLAPLSFMFPKMYQCNECNHVWKEKQPSRNYT